MKIAICFTGRIKTWEHNLKNIIDMLITSFGSENIDFFASIHGDIHDKYVIDFLNVLKPKFYNVEKIKRISRETIWKEKMYSGLFHKWKCIQLVEFSKINYDWVFTFRCDFMETIPIKIKDIFPKNKTLYVPTPEVGNIIYIDKRTPDHINAGSLETMKIFSEFFIEFDKYIDKGVPEDMLYCYIKDKGLEMNEFFWSWKLDERRCGYFFDIYE